MIQQSYQEKTQRGHPALIDAAAFRSSVRDAFLKLAPRHIVRSPVMAVVLAITYVLFRISPLVERALGHIGIVVLTRLFGILLAALSVQFVLDGLRDYGLVPG